MFRKIHVSLARNAINTHTQAFDSSIRELKVSFCNTRERADSNNFIKMSLMDVFEDIPKISAFYLISFRSNEILKNFWLKKNLQFKPINPFSAICTSIFSRLSTNICLIKLRYATRYTSPLKMLHADWDAYVRSKDQIRSLSKKMPRMRSGHFR